jgi:cytochrome c-type biogenesis protein
VKVLAPSYGRSTLIGMAFAAGWTPCIGPTLGGIIALATQSSTPVQGLILLVVFAMGLGIPFVLVAVGATSVSSKLLWFRNHETGVSLVTGGTLILVGFLMILNVFSQLSGFLPNIGI